MVNGTEFCRRALRRAWTGEESIPTPESWEEVAQTAAAHRLGPLLFTQTATREIPQPLRQRWLRDYQYNSIRNIWLKNTLQDLLQRMPPPVMLLKGAALLEQQIYPDSAVRPLADLDLLIPISLREQNREILTGLGFAWEEGASPEFEREWVFTRPANPPLKVELHGHLFTDLFYQAALPIDWFWERSSALPNGARVMLPIAQLLHLCAHACWHHSGRELLWQHDLARYLLRFGDQVTGDALAEQARAFSMLLPIQQQIGTLALDWNLHWAQTWLPAVQRVTPTAREQQLFQLRNAGKFSAGWRFWLDWQAIPTWGGRFRFFRQQIFPDRRYMRARYPIQHAWQIPIYYGVRWARGVGGVIRRGR